MASPHLFRPILNSLARQVLKGLGRPTALRIRRYREGRQNRSTSPILGTHLESLPSRTRRPSCHLSLRRGHLIVTALLAKGGATDPIRAPAKPGLNSGGGGGKSVSVTLTPTPTPDSGAGSSSAPASAHRRRATDVHVNTTLNGIAPYCTGSYAWTRTTPHCRS